VTFQSKEEATVALIGPDPEDKRKIHSEITQIVNQRLQLTVFAITLFGVIGAWLLPKNAPTHGTPVGAFTYTTTILLTCLLFALYFFSHFLRGVLRVFTSYLIVTNASGWEKDWESYTSQGYRGYTKAQTAVFLLLGLLSTAVPWGLEKAFNLVREPLWGFWADLVAGTAYVILICCMGFLESWKPESGARDKWEKLCAEKPSILTTPSSLP
jgi:hypothetical protein